MALLIAAGIVGGAVLLVALYCLGLKCAAYVVSSTKMFGEEVSSLVEKRRERLTKKKAEKEQKKLEQKEKTANENVIEAAIAEEKKGM